MSVEKNIETLFFKYLISRKLHVSRFDFKLFTYISSHLCAYGWHFYTDPDGWRQTSFRSRLQFCLRAPSSHQRCWLTRQGETHLKRVHRLKQQGNERLLFKSTLMIKLIIHCMYINDTVRSKKEEACTFQEVAGEASYGLGWRKVELHDDEFVVTGSGERLDVVTSGPASLQRPTAQVHLATWKISELRITTVIYYHSMV